MDRLRNSIWSLPALLTAAVIFYFSSLEQIDLPLSEISFNDLLFHGAGYFVFGLTLLMGAKPWRGFQEKPLLGCAILLVVGMLYALSDEIHQAFVPNRNCNLADFAADSLGVAMAMAGRILLGKRRQTVSGSPQ
ncbi:MAG: VanZ family protein [Thermodesulfobacteriota bacterium]